MKYVFGFLVGIAAIVILVVLLVSDPGKKSPQTNAKPTITLSDYKDTDDGVRFTTVGPVTADEDHYEIKMTITPKNRTFEVLQGYSGKVISTKILPNTPEAYNALIGGLSGNGFTQTAKKADKAGNESEACASGKRYIYQVLDEGSEKHRLWSSSCTVGTMGGNKDAIRKLFEKQFPDYKELAKLADL